MTGPKRRQTPHEIHERWLAWRRKMIEETLPEVCACYLGKTFVRSGGSCKDCTVCPGCEQHIKNIFWLVHDQSCQALKDLREILRCR